MDTIDVDVIINLNAESMIDLILTFLFLKFRHISWFTTEAMDKDDADKASPNDGVIIATNLLPSEPSSLVENIRYIIPRIFSINTSINKFL